MISAIALTFLGAFFLGTFALPSKYIKNYAWATVMAVAHFACIFFYGIGSGKFPAGLSTSVGFAIFQSGGLLIGNGLGIMTGEWKQADRDSKRWMYIGLAVLVSGIVIVSIGNKISS